MSYKKNSKLMQNADIVLGGVCFRSLLSPTPSPGLGALYSPTPLASTPNFDLLASAFSNEGSLTEVKEYYVKLVFM